MNKIHARGEFLYRSAGTGLSVYLSRCGRVDSLNAPLAEKDEHVNCGLCLRTRYPAKKKGS